MIQVGIIGVGTVGESVAQILEANRDIISARAGKEIVVKKGVVRNLSRARDVDIPLTDNVDEVLDDPEIDIVVELMGGVEEPYRVVRKALQNGKAVVTANKALLAYHRYELQETAGELPFEFEASVAGGIPIIKALREGLSANHIESIKGIINGTANYILTKMMNEGVDFEPVLKEAQELGYAEADPTFDIGGFDAAHKLLILASIAYGIDAKPEEIMIEGIEQITQADIGFAKEFGYTIKLLGIAKKVGEFVELRVHPALVPQSQMIAKVDGVMNGISVIGDKVGETMYYGPGAGGDATASAVISDIIAIARGGKASPMLGFKRPLESGLKLLGRESIVSKYYLRLEVADRPGVLAKVSQVMGEQNISIETMLQKPGQEGSASLLLATHACEERAMQEALKALFELESVKERPMMIRMEA
ncbi:homoserine dehydrogenase [Hydrogenimonas cancrithermarum]|uniref:Homoserine dehydrogenase n=1 Tax=Hydrogenimonas cancrithermarum TaxID=2993563 RepID=A0ABN6WUH0_9BACT|nr:homoserine dehydrogenase [Hydrogenimonas cancrithermarum]BDY12760.1 homoserine dehydrogenase [Hydrogenimonas cancrithermarum]